jgi:hypothetical protein
MAPVPEGDRPFSYRWLVIAILVAAGVYAWHVLTNFNRLGELNQREIASAAREVQRTFQNAVGTVEQFGARPGGNLCDFDRDQPYIEFISDCTKPAGDLSKTRPAIGPTGLEIQNLNGSARFRFRIGALLQEMPFPESFRVVFLAGPKGQVLYQESPEPRRWLRRLRWDEREYRENAPADAGPLRVQDLALVIGAGAQPGYPKLAAASSRLRLDLGGEWQQVYLQPVTLDNGADTSLVLGGIVPTRDMTRQALAVDTYFFAAIVFLFLTGLLGLPFVKLMVLDKRERFRVRDIHRLYVSSAALIALLTYVVLAADAWIRFGAAAGRGLSAYAASLETSLVAELRGVRDKLAEYDTRLAALPPRDCTQWPVQNNWLEAPPARQILNRAANVNLEQAAWLDSGGMQIWKATTDRIGNKVSVSRRDYYKSIRTGSLYTLPGEQRGFDWYPSRSITDGRFYTFLSMPSALPESYCAEARRGPFIAVATAKMLSLDRQPLPHGYGFALFNREGEVLYHSDARLSLRENLFAEVSSPSTLKALVAGGSGRTLTMDYRERPHEMHLRPLGILRTGLQTGSAGLFLAVFRDLSPERAAIAHVFVTSLIGPLMGLILVGAAALWALTRICRSDGGNRNLWLWPHGGLQDLYRRMSFAFAAILLLGAAAYVMGAGSGVFLLMPPAAAAAGTWIFATGDWLGRKRRRLSAPWWQRIEVTLLVVCMVAAPAAALFRVALGHEFATLIGAGRQWVREQTEDAALALRAEAIRDGFPAEAGDEVARLRKAYVLAPPAPFDIAPQPAGAPLLLRLHEWLGDILPVENETGVLLRYRHGGGSFAPSPPISLFGCVAFAGLTALLIAWIRWNSNYLLLADLEAVPLVKTADDAAQHQQWWDDLTPEERNILVQVTEEGVFNPYQRPAIEKMLAKGLLVLDPDLQPRTGKFRQFILAHRPEGLHDWEEVDVAHSWRYARLILGVTLGLMAVFLVATQPGLQSELLGVATGIAGALGTLVKVRDAIAGWMEKKRAAAGP